MAESPAAADWRRHPERSNRATLRLMAWLSLTCGRRAGRALLLVIALYFLLMAPTAREASRRYQTRLSGEAPSWRQLFKHFFAFATTVHDRVYLLNGRFDLFDIRLHGLPAMQALQESGQGALLMGAHLGSFEVIRAVGRHQAGLRVIMVMYEENARKINATLEAINPAATQDIIALGQLDSMLRVKESLEAGAIIGMLGDRGLVQDGTRQDSLEVDFLGGRARFPLGPWRMAAMLRRPVLFMTGLYRGGKRYDIHFVPLADFSQVERKNREVAIQQAIQAYAAQLEWCCREAPENWFNFFDFWRPEAGEGN